MLQQASSSDESIKYKSDEDYTMNRSIESSAKDESDESRHMDRTYVCIGSNACDCSGDAKFNNMDKFPALLSYNSDSESKTCSCANNKIWKTRNVYSLANNFEISKNDYEICNSKTDKSINEDLLAVDNTKDDSLLFKIRNYLAEFQELRGTSREEYTYSTLVRIMGQAIGHCLLALFYVILNIVPILEIVLHILRFMFDKIIDIKKTSSFRHIFFKLVIFVLEIVSIYVCLLFIFGFIISPVLRMSYGILSKIMLYD